jgi:hypothetical protein
MESTLIFKQPLFRKKLFISKQPYLLYKTEKDGIKELHELTKTVRKEGIWIFDADESIWFNIVASYQKKEIGLSTLQKGININNFGCTPTHYHIHPLKAEKMLEKHCIRYTGISKNDCLLERIVKIETALPSSADILTYVELIKTSKQATPCFKIISQEGLTEVGLQEPFSVQDYREVRKSTKLNIYREAKLLPDNLTAINYAFQQINSKLKNMHLEFLKL